MYIKSILDFLNGFFIYLNKIFPSYLVYFFTLFVFFLRRDHRKKNDQKEKNRKSQIWIILFCFSLALTVSLLFHLCPINGANAGIDSSVFLYIGKRMHGGYVPYRDLFDHKGPLLYFIQFFGLLLSGGRYFGVWIIELICLAITIYYTFKILCLSGQNKRNITIVFLTLFLTFFVIGTNLFEGGNVVEEYALPFIAFFCYVFFKFTQTKKCTKIESFLAGISFMSVLMLRVNMVSFWIIGIPIITGILIYHKRYKELLEYSALFIAGSITILTPILFYLIITNSLSNMLEYYLFFNFTYIKNYGGGGIGSLNQIQSVLYFMDLVWPVKIAVLLYIINIFNRIKKHVSLKGRPFHKLFLKNNKDFYFIVLIFTTIFATMSAKNFPHYILVLLPLFAVFVNFLLEGLNSIIDKFFSWNIPTNHNTEYSLKSLNLIFIFNIAIISYLSIFPFTLSQAPLDISSDYLIKNTNVSDNILIVGNASFCYLNSNRYYSGKFFYQTPPINVNSDIYNQFIDDFNKNNPDVVLIPFDEYNKAIRIENMLEEKVQSGFYKKEIIGTEERLTKIYRKVGI